MIYCFKTRTKLLYFFSCWLLFFSFSPPFRFPKAEINDKFSVGGFHSIQIHSTQSEWIHLVDFKSLQFVCFYFVLLCACIRATHKLLLSYESFRANNFIRCIACSCCIHKISYFFSLVRFIRLCCCRRTVLIFVHCCVSVCFVHQLHAV